MAFATVEDARAHYAGQDASALEVRVLMGAAARTVAALSSVEVDPVTGEPTAAYAEAAADAELMVGKWIKTTGGGVVSNKSLSGVGSSTYTKIADVQAMAASALGSFYQAPGRGRLRSTTLERG